MCVAVRACFGRNVGGTAGVRLFWLSSLGWDESFVFNITKEKYLDPHRWNGHCTLPYCPQTDSLRGVWVGSLQLHRKLLRERFHRSQVPPAGCGASAPRKDKRARGLRFENNTAFFTFSETVHKLAGCLCYSDLGVRSSLSSFNDLCVASLKVKTIKTYSKRGTGWILRFAQDDREGAA